MSQHISWNTGVSSFFVEICSLQLLICPMLLSSIDARSAPINITQHKDGDIMQMWPHENMNGIMRNALRPDAQNRWIHYKDKQGNYIIPYVIAGKYSQKEYKIIHGAFDTIAKNSCIQFRKKSSDQFDYVEIQNQRGQGCYTMVGRIPGKNVVMLEANDEVTCLLHQTVVHELFHTIGLWHEQMRHDRDDYIKVHYENIPNAYYAQFKKVPPVQAVTYGVDYDYTSVMHYAKDAFAMVPGAITMQTKKKSAQNVIGNVKDASVADWSKVCSIYNCPKCMSKSFKRGQKLSSKEDNKRNKINNKNLRDLKNQEDDKPITIWRIISLDAEATSHNQVALKTSSPEISSPVSSQQSAPSSSTSDDSTFYHKTGFESDTSSDTWKLDQEDEQQLQAANISLNGDNRNTKIVVITATGEWPPGSSEETTYSGGDDAQWTQPDSSPDNSYDSDRQIDYDQDLENS